MKTLYDLHEGGTFELGGKEYEILSKVAHGGMALVYKARLIDGAEKKYCIIKEFFPKSYHMGRGTENNENEVTYLSDDKKEITGLKGRVWREYEIAQALRHDEKLQNERAFFFQYEKPVEKNNTLYTVIQTEHGEMLSERIENRYFEDMNFAVICDCILNILTALEPLHNKKPLSYLHLDIAPDNIHFSELGIARLIDYNSAYCTGEPLEDFVFSNKEGYSAEELKRGFKAD